MGNGGNFYRGRPELEQPIYKGLPPRAVGRVWGGGLRSVFAGAPGISPGWGGGGGVCGASLMNTPAVPRGCTQAEILSGMYICEEQTQPPPPP